MYGGVWNLARPPTLPPVYPASGRAVPELQVMEDAFTQFMRARDITAGALCIARNDTIVYDRAFGWQDFLLTRALPYAAPFRLASLSKLVTAAAIRHLVSTGRLNYSDHVFHLGQSGGGLLRMAPFGAPDPSLAEVTVQHLLDHKGGWG